MKGPQRVDVVADSQRDVGQFGAAQTSVEMHHRP